MHCHNGKQPYGTVTGNLVCLSQSEKQSGALLCHRRQRRSTTSRIDVNGSVGSKNERAVGHRRSVRTPAVSTTEPSQPEAGSAWRAQMTGAPVIGLATAATLMFVAWLLPAAWNWDVHMNSWPPLHAEWQARVGPGTIPAALLGLFGIVYADRLAQTTSWRMLLVGTYLVGVAWMVSLATVDGNDGIGVILNTGYEYLRTARTIDSWSDVGTLLREYTARIPGSHPDHWPVHLAGHPPGAVLFFVLFSAIGLGSGLAAGWVVILVAATTPVAVLITLRTLGAERCGRVAAPFLVLGPAAIWMAVSADAVFAAFAAWGMCCLALASTRPSGWGVAAWGLLSGTLLGACVMMSYGLPLLGILAVAVLFVGRTLRPLPWALAAALAVVLTFAATGFVWWEALPIVHDRQYTGVAQNRPQTYYLWGNLAALCWSAGPVMLAGVAAAIGRGRASWREIFSSNRSVRVVILLVLAAVAMVIGADLSGASKGEVERIWLPFVPWLLLGTALLPVSWRRPGLAMQVGVALVVQHVLLTGW